MTRQRLVGHTLAHRFRLVKLLGEGAVGEVYLAEHDVLGRKYAVKVLKKKFITDHEVVTRFRREAQATSRLDHPNIVYVADFGRTEDNRFYLAMEYMPGRNLWEVYEDADPHLLPLRRTLDILRQVASALTAAHGAGVIHRDLKPENILLGEGRGGRDLVKILDFGLARILESEAEPEERLTVMGELFGTPSYMSPEQSQGEPMDHRTDLYSFGVMAFEQLTGRLPFESPELPEILRAHQQEAPPHPAQVRPPTEALLPAPVSDLVLQCLEKNPHRRPPQAAKIVAVLEGCLEDLPKARAASRTLSLQVGAPSDGDVLQRWSSPAGAETETEHDQATVRQSTGAVTAHLTQDPGEIEAAVVRRATALAEALLERGVDVEGELPPALQSLRALDEQILAQETELALVHARLEDSDAGFREQEARLRYAVIDLSVERGGLEDTDTDHQAVVADLDYQIQQLEKRLAALLHEKDVAQAEIERGARDIESELFLVREDERDLLARLLEPLAQARSQAREHGLEGHYQELDRLRSTRP